MSFEVYDLRVSSSCESRGAAILQTSLIVSARCLYSANTSASSCDSPFPTRFWYGFGSSADMVMSSPRQCSSPRLASWLLRPLFAETRVS